MTDTKDLIREIQEHTAAHGGENTATHLLVQAVMALQRQADEMAAIGAGGVSGPLLGGTLRTQAQPVGDDAEAAARRSFPQWWNGMGASLCGVDPLASSPPQTYAARGFMGGYVAALAAPQQEVQTRRKCPDELAEPVYIRTLCKALDAALDFAGTVAGGSSWWQDVWAELDVELETTRENYGQAQPAPQQEVQEPDDITVWKARALQAEAAIEKFMTQPAPSGDAEDAARWAHPKYDTRQREWCAAYEQETGFDPMMDDYEAGLKTFAEAAADSLRWYEDHTSDVHLRISGKTIPGGRYDAVRKEGDKP